jgi:multidrug resistance efflux pump
LLGRYALTLIAVAVAAFVAFIFWKQYAQTPWTRDGGFGQMWCRLRRMFPGR